jgi:predicted DNA-binding mobile mystery protein A
MKPNQKVIIEQLDNTLMMYKDLKHLSNPSRGWIRTIRETLGMSSRQLARRTGVSQQRLSKIEQQEIIGKIKLSTIKKIAEGLNCAFVYALLPQTTINDIIRQQAEKIVNKRFERVHASMVLEDQEVYGKEKETSYKLAIDKIINQMNKTFWDY